MGMCQSRRCMRACPCTKRDKNKANTEMTWREGRKPKERAKSDIVVHDMMPVETKGRPHSIPSRSELKTTVRPYSLPSMRKQIFINIEASPRNMTPSTEEEWFTPRDGPNAYCRIRRDSNENVFTFMVNEEHVKDVYVNYERIRSLSL